MFIKHEQVVFQISRYGLMWWRRPGEDTYNVMTKMENNKDVSNPIEMLTFFKHPVYNYMGFKIVHGSYV